MKARVKATGEIVDVVGTTQYDEYDVVSKDGVYFSLNQLELVEQNLTKNKSEDDVYWERLKHQYAGMAMQGMCMNTYCDCVGVDDIVTDAVRFATALVEKLKEKEERK